MRALVVVGAVAALLLSLPLIVPSRAIAKDPPVAGVPFEYKDGDVVCEGYLVKQPGQAGKRPGVLVVHDWMGQGEFSKRKADALARMGYVGFAVDVYGKGVRPTSPAEAAAEAGKWKADRDALRTRLCAAWGALLKDPDVEAVQVGAIGYCFGGTCALELGRAGCRIAAIVSFHGGLDSPIPEDASEISGKVLVLHGADDPHVPPKEVAAFIEEMRLGKVDWQLVQYGNAVHAFTNPAVGTDNSKGAAYNEMADERSWKAMKAFFAETFGR